MLLPNGIEIGSKKKKFIKNRELDVFIKLAIQYSNGYLDKMEISMDLAYDKNGKKNC